MLAPPSPAAHAPSPSPALSREAALRRIATAVAEGRPPEAVRRLADHLLPLAHDAAGLAALAEAERLVSLAVANAAERERLLRLAATDPLTGLANRRAFRQELTGELARAARHGRPLTLALIDVDRFKRVNDTSGHETGDAVLGAVGISLARSARGGDAIGRIGGEEFGWLMPETSIGEAVAAVERARASVAATRVDGIGALYAAKAAGRDRVVVT